MVDEIKAIRWAEAKNDAGLFRQYLAFHYGPLFEFGGDYDLYQRGRHFAARLARMINSETETVMQIAMADAAELFN